MLNLLVFVLLLALNMYYLTNFIDFVKHKDNTGIPVVLQSCLSCFPSKPFSLSSCVFLYRRVRRWKKQQDRVSCVCCCSPGRPEKLLWSLLRLNTNPPLLFSSSGIDSYKYKFAHAFSTCVFKFHNGRECLMFASDVSQ